MDADGHPDANMDGHIDTFTNTDGHAYPISDGFDPSNVDIYQYHFADSHQHIDSNEN